MSDAPLYSLAYRTAALTQRKPTRFDLSPDTEARAGIARGLDLIDLPRVRMKGEIRPSGRADFVLEADLEAEVVQACVLTLAPVPATIREHVSRRYVADWVEPSADETEVPEDDSAEPLGDAIDLGAVLVEALALALPLYPRAPGAEFQDRSVAAPGSEPLTDDKLRPFAGLANLMGKKDDTAG